MTSLQLDYSGRPNIWCSAAVQLLWQWLTDWPSQVSVLSPLLTCVLTCATCYSPAWYFPQLFCQFIYRLIYSVIGKWLMRSTIHPTPACLSLFYLHSSPVNASCTSDIPLLATSHSLSSSVSMGQDIDYFSLSCFSLTFLIIWLIFRPSYLPVRSVSVGCLTLRILHILNS